MSGRRGQGLPGAYVYIKYGIVIPTLGAVCRGAFLGAAFLACHPRTGHALMLLASQQDRGSGRAPPWAEFLGSPPRGLKQACWHSRRGSRGENGGLSR